MTVRVGLAVASRTGTAGAWALDLPGCHSAGDDEARALAGVQAALERYSDIDAKHGIGGPSAPDGAVAVTERVVVEWHGWPPVDTAFSVDRVAVTATDVRSTEAMLAATRSELLAVAARAGPGKAGDRSVEEMLYHVAGAEWWYATRLEEDPGRMRAESRDDLKDPRERLAAVRAWALARIHPLPALGVFERVHRGEGWVEPWTPRKVLRRFIYHELDHIAELAARAEA